MEDGPGRWGALLDLGLVLLDAGEDDRARRVLRQWRELPLVPLSFRPRAWTLLALAALERRAGDEATAGGLPGGGATPLRRPRRRAGLVLPRRPR